MAPKTDTSAKVDFGWPKWHQNKSKMEPKGIQNQCKIDSKINAEKVSENEAKMNQNWCRNGAKTDTKFILFAKWWFCENLAFTIIKARFSTFRGSKNRWEIDPKTMQKHDSKKWCKNDQKWCPNGVKIDSKLTKRVVKSRCENRCENQCKINAKRHPQKEGRRTRRQPP